MSKMQVPAENIPFCTIEPNVAMVNIPDARYNTLVDYWKPKSKVPASLKIVDIAGLVSGASDGEGMGNAFLSHINSVDPIRDMETISKELLAKDLQWIEKKLESYEK